MKSSVAYLVAPLIGWLIAQGLKNLLNTNRKGSGGIGRYLRSGDMPSAHTAVVVTLVTVIFLNEGFSSLFAVAAWFAGITIYDALVARRSIGEQGLALTDLLKKAHVPDHSLPRVAIGHTPLEVLAGAFLGGLVGLVVAIFITK